MAAFDSGAFDTGAFDTASAPATSVTSWRSVAEVISAYGEVKSRRVVAEALHLLPVTVPQPALTVGRAAVEAIGWAASYAGRRLNASRAVAEAIGTAGEQSPGLELPNISTTLSTLYLAFTPDTSAAGYLGLLDANGDGFSISWDAAASAGTLTWRLGGASTSTAVGFTSPVTVAALAVPAGTTFRELGLTRPYGKGAGGTLHEVALFNAAHSTGVRDQVRTYLREKWNEGGPATYADLCAAIAPAPGCSALVVFGPGIHYPVTGAELYSTTEQTYRDYIAANPSMCAGLGASVDGFLAMSGGYMPWYPDGAPAPDLLDPATWTISNLDPVLGGAGLMSILAVTTAGTEDLGTLTVIADASGNLTFDTSGLTGPLPTTMAPDACLALYAFQVGSVQDLTVEFSPLWPAQIPAGGTAWVECLNEGPCPAP